MCGKTVVIILATSVAAFSQPSLNRFYQVNAPWFQDVSAAALDAQSAAVISWLDGAGGWGGGRLQIDFSIEVLEADAATPMRSFVKTGDFYEGDCDFVQVPVPAGGALEGETGYQCLSDGDCHLIVFQKQTRILYEMWRANIVNSTFNGGCLAVWDLKAACNPSGRGEQCTSADAAGLPIAPLLFTPEEVEAGTVDHAIRFILPNARIRNRTYVHPGTHATPSASGGQNAPPYGTRLRLRADYPMTGLPNDAARAVARAMQKYGMILADGGTIALTGQSDRFSTIKWDGLLGPRDLAAIKVTDFQMVDGGTRYTWTDDCVRTPVVRHPTRPRPAQPSRHAVLTREGRLSVDAGIGRAKLLSPNGRIAAICVSADRGTAWRCTPQPTGVLLLEADGWGRVAVVTVR